MRPGKVTDAVKTGAWDIAFLAVDPARATDISFTAPYLEIDGTYLVPAESPLRTIEDVDREGVRVVVERQERLRSLPEPKPEARATGARSASNPESIALFTSDKLEAMGGVRQALVAAAAQIPGSRVLDGRFMVIPQAAGVPKGRDAGAEYLRAFIEDAKASGFVAESLKKSGVDGVTVAPPAPSWCTVSGFSRTVTRHVCDARRRSLRHSREPSRTRGGAPRCSSSSGRPCRGRGRCVSGSDAARNARRVCWTSTFRCNSSGATATVWSSRRWQARRPAEVPEQFRESIRWNAQQLRPEDEQLLASWPETVRVQIRGLGEVLFCHATPRNDFEIFTRLTPEEDLLPIFEGLDVPVVVCGHTHMQFDRTIGTTRVVNAGSVGMPFAAPGAYWLSAWTRRRASAYFLRSRESSRPHSRHEVSAGAGFCGE